MKTLLALALLLTGVSSFAQEVNSDFVLLKFSAVSIYRETKEVYTVKFTGCQRNGYFGGCVNQGEEKMQVLVNEKPVSFSDELLHRINGLYTQVAFSYYTEGIVNEPYNGPICAMGGPSTGTVLEAFYHVNGGDNKDIGNISSSKMTRISVEPSNCKFVTRIYPKNSQAKDSAIRLRTILETIGELNR